MIVRSFYLKRQFAGRIAALCTEDVIAVIRPERAIESLFSEAISVTIDKERIGPDGVHQGVFLFPGRGPLIP